MSYFNPLRNIFTYQSAGENFQADFITLYSILVSGVLLLNRVHFLTFINFISPKHLFTLLLYRLFLFPFLP
jgi:hypothetical protein